MGKRSRIQRMGTRTCNSHESLDSVYDQYPVWFASADDSPEELLNDKDMKEVLKQALQQLGK